MTALLRFNDRHWPALTLGVLAAVTFLSLAPLAEWRIEGPGSDKMRHLIAYAAIALPVALARPRRWGVVVLGLAAWSGSIELAQPFVNRHMSGLDWAANVAGLGLGTLAAAAVRWATGTIAGRELGDG